MLRFYRLRFDGKKTSNGFCRWRDCRTELKKDIIISSTTLRNEYNAIAQIAHEKGEPIFITQNGEGDLVVMSIEAFERREAMLDLGKKLLCAEQQRLNGEPTISLTKAEQRLKDKINRKI